MARSSPTITPHPRLTHLHRHDFCDRSAGAEVRSEAASLRACQLLLGHGKLESTVRYLGIEVDDALEISEQMDL